MVAGLALSDGAQLYKGKKLEEFKNRYRDVIVLFYGELFELTHNLLY